MDFVCCRRNATDFAGLKSAHLSAYVIYAEKWAERCFHPRIACLTLRDENRRVDYGTDHVPLLRRDESIPGR
jgi:hypothetical protein